MDEHVIGYDVVKRLFGDISDHKILEMNDGGTFPCRHCMKEAGEANRTLLFSHQLTLPKSVYEQPTAIFLCV